MYVVHVYRKYNSFVITCLSAVNTQFFYNAQHICVLTFVVVNPIVFAFDFSDQYYTFTELVVKFPYVSAISFLFYFLNNLNSNYFSYLSKNHENNILVYDVYINLLKIHSFVVSHAKYLKEFNKLVWAEIIFVIHSHVYVKN